MFEVLIYKLIFHVPQQTVETVFGNDDDDDDSEAEELARQQQARKESKLTNAPGPVKNGKTNLGGQSSATSGSGTSSALFPVSNGKQYMTMTSSTSISSTSNSNSKFELNDEEKQELIVCVNISYFLNTFIQKKWLPL